MSRKFVPIMTLMAGLLVLACTEPNKQSASSYREVQTYSIEQFMKTITIDGAAFSPDAKEIIYSSNASGVYNVYSTLVAGGEPRQLTNSQGESYFILSYFPNDNRILLESDRGGNELFHIFLRSEDGTLKDLTPGEKTRVVFHGWSYDDKSFFYGSNERNPRQMDLYKMDLETFMPQIIYQNDSGFRFTPIFPSGQHYFPGISPDKRYLALYETHSNFDSDMYLYDLESKELKHLSPHEGEIEHFPQTFSPDGKSLYYLTDRGREFMYLMQYDIASGKSEKVEEADWDINYCLFSRGGKYRVSAINSDAQMEIKIYETANNKPVSLPEFPRGVITAVTFRRMII